MLTTNLAQNLRRQFHINRQFNCVHHPSRRAVAVIGAHDLATRNNALRPLCADCLDAIRNVLAVLADSDKRGAI